MQEWRRSIDGFNMLEQPQPYFHEFKVGTMCSSGIQRGYALLHGEPFCGSNVH